MIDRIIVNERSPWKEAVGKTGAVFGQIDLSNEDSIYLVKFDDEQLNRYQSEKYGGFTFKKHELRLIKD